MKQEQGSIEKMHAIEGYRKINKLEQKIYTTKNNIEISNEIIADTSSDAQRAKLTEKNKQRQHAVGSMQKEVRDIEQTLERRKDEVST